MTENDFSSFLQSELNQRNWSKADLARASGLSSAQITRIMKREQSPGPEACNAIATALKLPPEMVFRLAGLLPPNSRHPEDPPNLAQWIHIFLQADESERDRMIEVAKTLLRESKK